jgi:hypothetical protein
MNSVKMPLCLLSRLSEPEFCCRVSDDEKMETNRKKSCPSVESLTDDPVPSTSLSTEKMIITPEVPHQSAQQKTDADLARKTVMESDPDKDDILVATPLRPPLPKPIPCQKKTFTCSGLPVKFILSKSLQFLDSGNGS